MLTRTLVIMSALGIAAPALAQDATTTEYVSSRDAAGPLRKGAYVPFAMSPSADGVRVQTFATYDSARDRAGVDASAQVPLLDRVQLQVALNYDEGDSDLLLAGQFDLLRERSAPIDLQFSAGWADQGVNDVAAVFGQATVGRSLPGDFYAFGGARFDFATNSSEAGMRVTAAAVRPMGYGLVAGIDSKLEVDLERDATDPPTESTWALQVGPVIGYSKDLVAVTASVGLATNAPSNEGNTSVGAFAGAGLGIAL